MIDFVLYFSKLALLQRCEFQTVLDYSTLIYWCLVTSALIKYLDYEILVLYRWNVDLPFSMTFFSGQFQKKISPTFREVSDTKGVYPD